MSNLLSLCVVLCGIFFPLCTPAPAWDSVSGQHSVFSGSPRKKLLLISFDGFRWDYDRDIETPNLDKMARDGVKALYVTPPFLTITSPAHFSLLTGNCFDLHGGYEYNASLYQCFALCSCSFFTFGNRIRKYCKSFAVRVEHCLLQPKEDKKTDGSKDYNACIFPPLSYSGNYVENHGVIHNIWFNTTTQEKKQYHAAQFVDSYWDNGSLPIWITAQRQVYSDHFLFVCMAED